MYVWLLAFFNCMTVSREELTVIYQLVQSLSYNDSFELTKTGFDRTSLCTFSTTSWLMSYSVFMQQYFTFWRIQLENPEINARTWEVGRSLISHGSFKFRLPISLHFGVLNHLLVFFKRKNDDRNRWNSRSPQHITKGKPTSSMGSLFWNLRLQWARPTQ